MELLKTLLMLAQDSTNAVMMIIQNFTKTSIDLLVILLALIQLDTEWTALRKELTSRYLIYMTMNIKQRNEFNSSVTLIMQYFLSVKPEICVECIIKSYASSYASPEAMRFFSLLFDSCYKIPSFIPYLKTIPINPVKPNLYLLVHLYYREAIIMNDDIQLEHQMNLLLDKAKFDLLNLLIDSLYDYSNNTSTIIDNPALALWTLRFLEASVDDIRLNAVMANRYTIVRQNTLNTIQSAQYNTVQMILSQWIQGDNRTAIPSQLQSIINSPDGGQIISMLCDEVMNYLDHIMTFKEYEAYNIIELIGFLANNNLFGKNNYVFMLRIADVMLTSANTLNHNLGSYLINSISPTIKNNLEFVKQLLLNVNIKNTHVIAKSLQKILNESQAVMSHPNDASLSDTPYVPISKEKLAVAKKHQQEITQEIVPVREEVIDVIPDERVKNRISVLVNNITNANIASKIDDFCSLIPGYELWFANMLVRSRIERQNNFHELYMDLVDRLTKRLGSSILDHVMHCSIQVTKELLTAEYSTFLEEHAFLKIMGEWLGTITISRDVCLSNYHMNLSKQLYIAFYHKRLLYVYEFVCFILRACKKSKVLHPPQPWLMSLLSLLKEIREIPGIVNKIGYLYENFLSNNGYKDSDIVVQDSELYLAIPEIANNNDFSDNASESEVYAYFQKRYPQLVEFTQSESPLRALANTKNSFHEFYPKNKSMSPVVAPTHASAPQEETNMVNIPASLKELPPNILSQLQTMICEIMELIITNYMKTIVVQFNVVCTSLYGMYYRDLIEIQDFQEIMTCLEKPALTMVQSLISIVVKDLEKAFLQKIHSLHINSSYVNYLHVEEIVKVNIVSLLNELQTRLLNSILESVQRDIQNDRQTRKDSSQKQNMLSYKEFMKTEGLHRNEVVFDGALNPDQKAIYTNFTEGPSYAELLLTDEELHQVSIDLIYSKIEMCLRDIINNENKKDSWNTQVEFMNDPIYMDMISYFEIIKDNHNAEKDAALVHFIAVNCKAINNFHILVLLVKLAKLFDSYGIRSLDNNNNPVSITDYFTSLNLENIEQDINQLGLRLPVYLLLVSHGLLNIEMFDEAFSYLLNAKTNTMAMEYIIRFVNNCLNNLIIVHEVISPESIPKTMHELERITKSAKDSKHVTESEKIISSLYSFLQKKQELIAQRTQIKDFMQTPEYVQFETACIQGLEQLSTKNDVSLRTSKLTEMVACFDKIVKANPDLSLYCLMYAIFDSVYSHFNTLIQESHAILASSIMPFFTLFFSSLLQRETSEKRIKIASLILNAFRSHFFMCHDVFRDTFSPSYFSSFLFNWLKQVILEEKTAATREQYLVDFAHLLYELIPQNAPSFIIAWMQLLSSPQILSILIGEKIASIIPITVEMLSRLLSFCHSMQVFSVSQRLSDHMFLLIRTILISFPGFLCRHCYDLILLLPEQLQFQVLNDCPPEFAYSHVQDEQKIWDLVVEPSMPYKQDLARFVNTETLETMILQNNLKQAVAFLSRIPENRFPAVIRALTMFFVLEEENIRKKAADGTNVLSAGKCIYFFYTSILDKYRTLFLELIVNYLRFPCKETKLFMNVFLELYDLADEDTQNLMRIMLQKRHKSTIGANLTYKKLFTY